MVLVFMKLFFRVKFSHYPYRLFSGQGILGLCFFSSLLWENYLVKSGKPTARAVLIFLCAYLLIFHSTFSFRGGRPGLNIFNSTYAHFFKADMDKLLEFKSIFYPADYYPIVDVIKKHTRPQEIISSNIDMMTGVFSALSGRPAANSMFYEIKARRAIFEEYVFARLIVWIKPPVKTLYFLKNRLKWQKIYENKIAIVFENPNASRRIYPAKAVIPFKYIGVILAIIFMFLAFDLFLRNKK